MGVVEGVVGVVEAGAAAMVEMIVAVIVVVVNIIVLIIFIAANGRLSMRVSGGLGIVAGVGWAMEWGY